MGWAKSGEEPRKGAGGKKERVDSQIREVDGGERKQRMEEEGKSKKATAGREIDFRLSQGKIRGQPRPVL